jgi:acetyltransferase-like isoleucine patch superfamily enzyme
LTAETLVFRQYYSLLSRCRAAFYRWFGMKIGSGCRLESIRARRPRQIELGRENALTERCWLWPIDADYDGIRIRVGNGNYFNRDCMIDACGYVEIGSRNMFGPGVYITDSNHTMPGGGSVIEGVMDIGQVVIGNDCWVGAKAVILRDVVLGDRCVVGAGAVVTKSFPAGSVIAGVPAKLLRETKAATSSASHP